MIDYDYFCDLYLKLRGDDCKWKILYCSYRTMLDIQTRLDKQHLGTDLDPINKNIHLNTVIIRDPGVGCFTFYLMPIAWLKDDELFQIINVEEEE